MSLINDADDLDREPHHHRHHHSSSRKKFLHPNEKDDRRHQHHHHHHHHHPEKKSWKRPADEEESYTASKQVRTDDVRKDEGEETAPVDERPVVEKSEENELISEENLLELRKQLIRAELAGDDVRLARSLSLSHARKKRTPIHLVGND